MLSSFHLHSLLMSFLSLSQASKIKAFLKLNNDVFYSCKPTKVAAGVTGVTGVLVTRSVQEKERDFAPQRT